MIAYDNYLATTKATLGRIGWLCFCKTALGLYAFGYAAFRFLIFVELAYGFNLGSILEAIFEKHYALVGFGAFLILFPLAIMSTKGRQKRLGQLWRSLHRWVYLAEILVVVHYVWLVKSDIREPLAWGVGVVLLLALRIPRVRKLSFGTS